MSAIDPTLYPTYIYRTKLLFPQYLKTENYTYANIIDANVEGDFFLYNFIIQLDRDTFSIKPEGLSELADIIWDTDDWCNILTKVADESRKHAWCILQFYEEGSPSRWRVFSKAQFTDWVRKIEDDGLVTRIGASFNTADDLGNKVTEKLLFDDQYTHLIKFRPGNNMEVFAESDLPNALMDIVFNLRQIKGQLDFIGSKPGFKHFVYAQGANEDDVKKVDAKIPYVDLSAGIGASESTLKEIRVIKDEHMETILPAFDKGVELFAGATRLPISYFLGQRQTTGMSDVGEKTDLLRLDRRKANLFQHYLPYIKAIFLKMYEIELDDIEYPTQLTMEEEEEDNGQQDQRTDSQE